MFSSAFRGVLDLRIATKLYLGFGFVLLMLVLVGSVGILALRQIHVQMDKTEATSRIREALTGASTARLQYGATFDKRHIAENENRLKEMAAHIDAARAIPWKPESVKALDDMAGRLSGYRQGRDRMVERHDFQAQTRAGWNETDRRLEAGYAGLTQRLLASVDAFSMDFGAGAQQRADTAARLEKEYALVRYALRGLVIDQTDQANRAVLESLDTLYGHTETLRSSLPESDQAQVSTILTDLAAYRKLVAAYMPAVAQAREANDAMQATATQLNTITKALADRIMAEEAQLLRDALRNMLIIAVIAIALGGLAAWLIARQITRPLAQTVAIAERIAQGDLSGEFQATRRDEVGQLLRAMRTMQDFLATTVTVVRQGVHEINGGAREIASGNADLSSRSEEQAASLEETAASMEELASTVRNNAENAHQASRLATTASEVAVRGGQSVQEVVTTMDGISRSSGQIAEIIGVIEGIAFQTNILALNAAVEAARAGEQGKGFAVVAGEVRTLAQRSGAAAKEIKELIGDSADRVSAGSRQVQGAAQTMQEIVDAVRRATDIMQEIAVASQEQARGIEQVNQAVGQMDATTQQNAALVEEAAAASASLESQAERLAQAVAIFKLRSDEVIDMRADALAGARQVAPQGLAYA
jgi:methyl-accepting chemotaxis protein-2 (aspartate sensor receptor)